MAERLTGRPTYRSFGTGQGIGLIATALLTISLTLPMASTALGSRAVAEGNAAEPAQANQLTGAAPADVPGVGVPGTGVPGTAAPGNLAEPDGENGLQTAIGRRQATAVEKHIATLHRMLHITPLQEPLWQSMASAMRGNMVELDHAYARREKLHGSMSAVDDLKSYGMVQQIHARNVQNLIGPFQLLYDSFGPSQKKLADDTFRSFTDNAVKNSR